MDIQTCPRRMREMGPWPREEGLDSWSEDPRREGEITPFCSFCGSLHPGKFLELVASGWVTEPTDKTYKAYLCQAPVPQNRTAAPGQPLSVSGSRARSKFYFQHLSDAQQEQFVDLYNKGMMRFAEPGHFYVLPFFMHLVPPAPEGGR